MTSALRKVTVDSPETPTNIYHSTRHRDPEGHRVNLRLLKISVRGSNPGGGEIFRTRPDRPCGPPSLLYSGYRVFPGGKAAGAWR
jgi:hypothetical protein